MLCKKKIPEAIKWFKRAAAVADGETPESLYQLHLIYANGRKEDKILVDQGYSRSVLMEAAQLKYPPALFKVCIERGLTTVGWTVPLLWRYWIYKGPAGSLEVL